MKLSQKKVGALLSYVSEAIRILTALIYTPIMLRLLGQSEYGLYQRVHSVVSYLSLLSLGFGSAYVRFYSRAKAKNDENGVAKLNGMFMTIFCVISLICILCGVVLVKNIRTVFSTGLTEAEYPTARILMIIMIANLAMTFPNSVFNCIITANERFIFQKTLLVLHHLSSPFLTLPLLIMGYGSIGMVSVTTALTAITFLVNVYYCMVKLNTRFYFHEFDFMLLREMWMFTFFIFLNQIIDQINWSVDKFLLGRFAGTGMVAIYGVGGQINSLYITMSSSISNVFGPQVNRIVAERDDNEELSRLMTKVGRVQFYVMMLVLSGFVFFGQTFVRLWAGKNYGESFYVAMLLMFPVTIPLIQNIGIEIQRAKNRHQVRSIVYFIVALANIVISIPLIMKFGAVGAAAGTAITTFIGSVLFINYYYQVHLKLDMQFFWSNIIFLCRGLIIPILCGIAIHKFAHYTGWMRLGFWILVYAAIYSVSVWFFSMNEYEKNLVTGGIKRIRRNRKQRG